MWTDRLVIENFSREKKNDLGRMIGKTERERGRGRERNGKEMIKKR